jgi:hypothetical protein
MKENMTQHPRRMACGPCGMAMWHIAFEARVKARLSQYARNGGEPRPLRLYLRCLGCGHVTPRRDGTG